MHLVWGLRRFAVLAAVFAFVAVLAGPLAAHAQDTPACSDGVDNDGDNYIDGADAGCGGGSDNDETDSPYAGIEIQDLPLPLVTLQGTVDTKKGDVKVSRLQIRALIGSVVEVTCKGKTCPFMTFKRQMFRNSLRLEALERKLKAPTTLTLRVGRQNQLGKFVQYKLRRGKAPVRVDDCLAQDTGERKPCYED